MKIRAVIVDDEDAGLARLRQLATDHADLRIVGEARTGAEAVERLHTLAPDLVFLDVQLGGMTGLGVLEALPAEDVPHVVFVTAYDRYAAGAFDHAAVDYLLKPCSPERFARAVDRVRARIAAGHVAPLRDELLSAWRTLVADRGDGTGAGGVRDLDGAAGTGGNEAGGGVLGAGSGAASGAGLTGALRTPASPSGLFVEDGGRFVYLDVAQIDYVEAARNYVVIHAGKASYCHRAPISALEHALDAARFARVHKSVIVNLSRIASVESDFNGTYVIRLTSGATCRSGPSYRTRIQGWLKAPFR